MTASRGIRNWRLCCRAFVSPSTARSCGGDAVVGDGDEVALIPPVAGGSGRYAIGEEKLDLADLIDQAVEVKFPEVRELTLK